MPKVPTPASDDDDVASVRDAESRYAERYQRRPRENPKRVVLEITIERRLGMA